MSGRPISAGTGAQISKFFEGAPGRAEFAVHSLPWVKDGRRAAGRYLAMRWLAVNHVGLPGFLAKSTTRLCTYS